MKIGIFTNCYHPLVNGVVGAVSLLRKGFLEAGHDVFLFAPSFDKYQDLEPNIFRYPSVDLTYKVKYPVAIPFSLKVQKALDNLPLDIIHSHHPFVLGPVGLRLAHRRKIPFVYTFHTQYDQYNHYIPLPAGLVRKVTRRQVQRFCQAVDQVTTPADSARQILLDYGVTNTIQVIANPIDVSRFQGHQRDAVRKKYNLTHEKLLINIGRIAPEKNLGLLLHSFKLMLGKASANSLKLMVVGDGPALKSLIELADSLEINESVIFTGLVDTAQIPQYLAAADLFVMTSTTEVKPLAQLEALAAGVPIVAVSAAGANDTIIHGQNGLLVSLNEREFSEAVLSLAFDPVRHQAFQEKARKTAQSYSYATITGEYLALFDKLIDENKAHRG